MSPPTRDAIASLMPELTKELARLVAIPSVSATNYPPETHAELISCRDVVVELLEGAGVQGLQFLDLPDTAPVVIGEIPAPEGAPPFSSTGTTTSCRQETRRSGIRRRTS